jgi:uncharacterized integral membrane protein
MRFVFIIALFVLAVALIFALQNTATTSISFLIWRREISLALALLIAFLLGVVVVALALLPSLLSQRFKATSRKRRAQTLQAELKYRSDRPAGTSPEKRGSDLSEDG